MARAIYFYVFRARKTHMCRTDDDLDDLWQITAHRRAWDVRRSGPQKNEDLQIDLR